MVCIYWEQDYFDSQKELRSCFCTAITSLGCSCVLFLALEVIFIQGSSNSGTNRVSETYQKNCRHNGSGLKPELLNPGSYACMAAGPPVKMVFTHSQNAGLKQMENMEQEV